MDVDPPPVEDECQTPPEREHEDDETPSGPSAEGQRLLQSVSGRVGRAAASHDDHEQVGSEVDQEGVAAERDERENGVEACRAAQARAARTLEAARQAQERVREAEQAARRGLDVMLDKLG